jgi:hypothetical protein
MINDIVRLPGMTLADYDALVARDGAASDAELEFRAGDDGFYPGTRTEQVQECCDCRTPLNCGFGEAIAAACMDEEIDRTHICVDCLRERLGRMEDDGPRQVLSDLAAVPEILARARPYLFGRCANEAAEYGMPLSMYMGLLA